jgi:hypothetical protein
MRFSGMVEAGAALVLLRSSAICWPAMQAFPSTAIEKQREVLRQLTRKAWEGYGRP